MIEISNMSGVPMNEKQIIKEVSEIFKAPVDSKVNVVRKFENSPHLEGFAMRGRKDVYVSVNGFDLRSDARRFAFLILHEMGHSLGLAHCNNRNCVMFLKQTKKRRLYGWKMLTEKDRLDVFCDNCRKFINQNLQCLNMVG